MVDLKIASGVPIGVEALARRSLPLSNPLTEVATTGDTRVVAEDAFSEQAKPFAYQFGARPEMRAETGLLQQTKPAVIPQAMSCYHVNHDVKTGCDGRAWMDCWYSVSCW